MVNGEILLDSSSALRVSAGSDHAAEAERVIDAAREQAGKVPVGLVGPTGASGLEPLVFATRRDRTAIVPSCDPAIATGIVDAFEDGTDAFERGLLPADATLVAHDSDQLTLPLPKEGPLSVGHRRVLATAGWLRPTAIEEYRTAGSIVASDAAADEEILDRLEDGPLRGRGRGDATTDAAIADAWTTVRESDADPIVVVDANEATPNAAMDRLLLESTPFAVLDGAATAARTVGASEVVVYLNETDKLAQERVRDASETLTDALTENGRSISMEVVTGPDEYKAGEMTMALEALEGNHRLEARLRPPTPSESGLNGRPTLIHTPRTLAQVTTLLREETDEDAVGVDADPGTRVLTVTGDVASPVTLELSTADELSTVREAVRMHGELKAACVGDVFGGITDTLAVPASVNGLTAAQLGTNASSNSSTRSGVWCRSPANVPALRARKTVGGV